MPASKPIECSGSSVAVPNCGLKSWNSDGALPPVPALALQLAPDLGDLVGRGRAPGVEGLDVAHLVDPPAERKVQPVEDRDLVQGEDRIGRLLGGDRARPGRGVRRDAGAEAVGGVALGAGPEGEGAGGAELPVALVLGADALADELRPRPAGGEHRDREEVVVAEQETLGVADVVEAPVGLVRKQRHGAAQHAAEQVGDEPAIDVSELARRVRGRIRERQEGGVVLGAVEAVAAAELEPDAVRDVDADAAGEAGAPRAVGLEAPGREIAQARDAVAEAGEAGRVEGGKAEGVVDAAVAARDAALRLLGAVAAGLDRDMGAGRAAALPGDDIHDPAHRIRPVQRRLRAAQDLDALDVGEDERRKIELAPGRRGVVDADAVDHDEGVARFAAAHAHGLDLPGAAVLGDGEARRAAQEIADVAHARLLDLVRRDDGDGAAGALDRLRGAAWGDDDVGLERASARGHDGIDKENGREAACRACHGDLLPPHRRNLG